MAHTVHLETHVHVYSTKILTMWNYFYLIRLIWNLITIVKLLHVERSLLDSSCAGPDVAYEYADGGELAG